MPTKIVKLNTHAPYMPENTAITPVTAIQTNHNTAPSYLPPCSLCGLGTWGGEQLCLNVFTSRLHHPVVTHHCGRVCQPC